MRRHKFEVKSIQEDNPGISDEEVIEIALRLNLIILTFDSDYGELIFRYSKKNPPAVIFFREKGNAPEFADLSLISLLNNPHIDLLKSFSVVETNNVRQRFYK